MERRATGRRGRAALLVPLALLLAAAAWLLMTRAPEAGPAATGPILEAAPESPGKDLQAAPLESVGSDGTRSAAGDQVVEAADEASLESMSEEPVDAARLIDGFTVRGVVLDPRGEPMAGASVAPGTAAALSFLRDDPDPALEASDLESLDLEDGTLTTDEDGRFEIAAPSFPLRLTAGARGFAPSETLLVQGAPERDERVRLQLRHGGTIRVTVIDRDGGPVPQRRVRFLRDADAEASPSERQLFYALTDDTGTLLAEHLEPGTWDLVTIPDESDVGTSNYLSQLLQASIELEDGEEETVVMGGSPATAVQVSGQVTLAGEPSRGMVHWIHEGEDPNANQTYDQMGPDGRYEVELTRPGRWYVRTTGGNGHHEESIEVPPGPTFTHDVALPEGRIAGLVVDASGKPIGATVTLMQVGGMQPRGSLRIADDRTITDKEGRFELDGLEPGNYLIGAWVEFQGTAWSEEIEVPEPGARVDGITLTLGGDGTIAGEVRTSNGLPAAMAPIWIHDALGRVVNPLSMTRSRAGSFETPQLPEGTYSLYCQTEAGAVMSGPLRVPRADDAEPLELTLAPGGDLAITITRAGSPVRGDVVVRDLGGRIVSGLRDSRDPFTWRRFPMDSRMRYLGPLPPGDYRVTGYLDGLAVGTGRATVAAGETTEVTVPASGR